MNSEIKYIVDKNIVSLRLDRALTLLNKEYSRAYFSNMKLLVFLKIKILH